MTTVLVTGGSGLVGAALIRRLRADGAHVLATARSRVAERVVRELGAEPIHSDLANLDDAWERELAPVELVYHLGLPRLDPPLRRAGARRHTRSARSDAAVLAEAIGDRPRVVASTALGYAVSDEPPRDDAPLADRPPALARAALAAERGLEGPATRIVRLPWVYGPAGLLRDVIVGLRTRRYRIVGPGDNPWALLSAEDAAGALIAAAGAPAGVYSAAEADVPTQRDVVTALCSVPGHRRPDHSPPGLAGIAMGGAMARALAAPMRVATGRLAERGWEPAGRWREGLRELAENPLPIRE